MLKQIKYLIKIKNVVESYGISLNSRNKAKCPFHSEKTESFFVDVNRNRFYCFGCSEDGDSIDFVSKMFNISITDACKKINEDFNLGLGKKLTIEQKKQIQKRVNVESEKEKERKEKEVLKSQYFENFSVYDNICIHRIERGETPDNTWIHANEKRIYWYEKYLSI